MLKQFPPTHRDASSPFDLVCDLEVFVFCPPSHWLKQLSLLLLLYSVSVSSGSLLTGGIQDAAPFPVAISCFGFCYFHLTSSNVRVNMPIPCYIVKNLLKCVRIYTFLVPHTYLMHVFHGFWTRYLKNIRSAFIIAWFYLYIHHHFENI